MSKKWMAVVVGAVIVAVALGAALFLIPRNTPSPTNPNGGSATSTASNTSSTSASGTTGSTTPTLTQGSTTAPSTTTGTSGSTTSAGTSKTNPAALGKLKPFPPLPDPTTTKAMTSPAAPGEKLPRVASDISVPTPTWSAAEIGRVPDGSSYTIEMRPYGIGPEFGGMGSGLVILIDSATPLAGAPAYNVLAHANWRVLVNTLDNGTVSTGGKYTAKLTFRSDGSKLLPILSNVKAAK